MDAELRCFSCGMPVTDPESVIFTYVPAPDHTMERPSLVLGCKRAKAMTAKDFGVCRRDQHCAATTRHSPSFWQRFYHHFALPVPKSWIGA